MLYALFYRSDEWRPEHHLFMIGSAVYLGYLWVTLIMAGLQHWTLPVFSDWLLAWAAVSFMVCVVVGTVCRMAGAQAPTHTTTQTAYHPGIESNSERFAAAALLAWLVLIAAPVFWEVAFRPAVGWDTVSFWADHGRSFLLGQLDNDNLNAMSSGTHPVTIKYVGAWGAFSIYERSAAWLYLPWAALYLGVIFAAIGLGKILSGKWWVGLAGAVFMASSPVIQAHTALGGYADAWLGAGLFLALAWLAMASHQVFRPIAVVGLLAILAIISLAFLKGNAVAYSAIILGAMVFAWAWSRWHWAAVVVLFGAFLLAVLWVVNNGIDWSFGAYRVTFLPEEGRFALGQRQSALASNSWVEIGRNIWYAWGVSSSFYLAGFLGVLVSIVGLVKGLWRKDWVLLTAIFLLMGLTVFFVLGQYLSAEHLFGGATPDRDVSLSRFSQILHFVIIFVAMALASNTTNKLSSTHSQSGER